MRVSDVELEDMIRQTLVAVADSERDPETTVAPPTSTTQRVLLPLAAAVVLLVLFGGLVYYGPNRDVGDVSTAAGPQELPPSVFPRSLDLSNGARLEVNGARRYAGDGPVTVSVAYLGAEDVTVEVGVLHGSDGVQTPPPIDASCGHRAMSVRGTTGTISGTSGGGLHLWWTEAGVGVVQLRSVSLTESELIDFAESLAPVTGEAWEGRVAVAGEIAEGPPDESEPTSATTTIPCG